MAEEKKQIVLTGAELLNAYRNEQAKMDALQRRIRQLQGIMAETLSAEEAVNTIKKAAKNEKIMVNLGAGIYTEAMLNASEKFKISLAGTVLEGADAKKALAILQEQKEKAQKDMEMTQKDTEKSAAALNEITRLLQMAENQARQRRQPAQKTGSA